VPSQSDLEAALLSAAQVGPNFTQQPEGSGIGENSLSNACPAVGGGANPSAMAIRAFVANPNSTNITDVTEELLQYTVGQAEQQLTQFAQVADACPEFTVTLPTSSLGVLTIQIGIANEAIASIGDQSAALRVTADVTNYGVIVTGDIVAVRHGGTVILVVNVALQVDSNLTSAVTTAAFNNVAARW
jgi:hypothetical protein